MTRLHYSFNNGIRSPRKILSPETATQAYEEMFIWNENLKIVFF
jgi:hypothetical protein